MRWGSGSQGQTPGLMRQNPHEDTRTMNPDALREAILTRLSTVIDPETGADVVRMRLIEDLSVDDDGMVRYTFRPSSPLCPLAVTLALQIKDSVTGVSGVAGQEINVEGYVGAEKLSDLLRAV